MINFTVKDFFEFVFSMIKALLLGFVFMACMVGLVIGAKYLHVL